MTTGWPTRKLGEITSKVGSGSTPRGGEAVYKAAGIPLIRSMNVHFAAFRADGLAYLDQKEAAKLDHVVVQAHDVLLNITGASIGRVTTAPASLSGARVNQHVCIIRPAPGLSAQFLANFLASPDQQARVFNVQVGATRQALTKSMILDWSVPIPPIAEQHAIVAEIEKQFTRLDAGVAALRKAQAKLKRYRAAILKAACEGRLVPTEAELARKDGRAYETGEQLLARTLVERRANWTGRGKYTEPNTPDIADLPALPNGWTWATVEQLSSRVQYGSSAKTRERPIGIPVVRMGNIAEGRLHLQSVKYLPVAHSEFPELLLTSGDLLFNRTNSAELVGKTAVYHGTPRPCSFASYLIRVRLIDGCLPDYIAYFINSPLGRAWIASVASQQVGQANVNGTKLQALRIPLPPEAEQERIVAEVERRLSIVAALEQVVTANLQRAARLRQSILDRAFTGRLVNALD